MMAKPKCACGKKSEYIIYVCKGCAKAQKEFGFKLFKVK